MDCVFGIVPVSCFRITKKRVLFDIRHVFFLSGNTKKWYWYGERKEGRKQTWYQTILSLKSSFSYSCLLVINGYQRSTESENKVDGRWRYWLEQWVDTQLSKNSDTAFPSNVRIREEYGAKLKPRNSHKPHHIEDFELDPPISIQRRSFHHKKQNSVGNDSGFPSFPIIPTYMAATESAKAKLRSMSSPRLRGVNFDAHSESNSPYKHKLKLSPISSINSEVTSSSRVCDCKFGGVEQISPSLKGFPRPVKSNRSSKDLSFDSESSFLNRARNGSSR